MSATSDVPTRIGRYDIHGVLGRGAMGIVYEAKDPRIGRVVALKTLAVPPGADPAVAAAMRQRFLNEGKAAGRLAHPTIVTVYDADEDPETGLAYLAMELVDGEELKVRYGQPLAPEELLGILREVADALDHAHSRGVIHRDIKPSNILVTRDGHAKLTDFGIARLGDQSLTQEGQFLGSPAYMSPEQVRGKAITPASDIYSLAVVIYEGLTAHWPFERDDLLTTTHAIANEDAPPPRTWVERLPRAVDDLFTSALAKDPARRPATATELIRKMEAAFAMADADTVLTGDLRAAARDSGEAAGADSPGMSPRLRRALLVAAVLAGVAALVGGGAWLMHRRAQPAPGPVPTAGGAAHPGGAATAPPVEPNGRLEIEIATATGGTLVVRSDGSELLRKPVADTRHHGLSFRSTKQVTSFSLPLRPGPHDLEFVYEPLERPALVRKAREDIPSGRTARAHLEVTGFGRQMDLTWL